MQESAGGGVYGHAELYDIAFDFRDVAAECDFLEGLADAHGSGSASFLECACGPGRHVIEMARRGRAASGLDLEPAMIAHLERGARAAGVTVETIVGDMRSFESRHRFASAALLMDSVTHLLTNTDMVRHLRAVAAHLVERGIYVLEMAHPSNHFGVAETAGTEWEMERDGVRVATRWGLPDDRFDSLTQVDEVTVEMVVTSPGGETERVVDHLRTRRWTKPHFEALVELSGVFEVVEWHGSLRSGVPLDHDPKAWRMVPVLRRSEAVRSV